MNKETKFDPSEYWNKRLDNEFTLKGVGYISFSAGYNKWLYQRKENVLLKIFKDINVAAKTNRVLDIGCGTGFFVKQYLKVNAQVAGVDITTRSVEELTAQFPNSTFRVLDISSNNGSLNETFDIINMWDVMYHIVDDAAFARACNNISSMSKPGTYFIVTDMMAANKMIRPAEHVCFRTRKEYELTLGEKGFVLQKQYPLYRFLNRHYRWSDGITNKIAPLLCSLDNFNNTPVSNNLCVAVWKKEK